MYINNDPDIKEYIPISSHLFSMYSSRLPLPILLSKHVVVYTLHFTYNVYFVSMVTPEETSCIWSMKESLTGRRLRFQEVARIVMGMCM